MTSEPVSDVVEVDVDDDIAEPPRPRRKGIYILPNLFTLGALFGGFYAIVMAMNGRFENACIGIFCAAVLDSLDGRVARMTNTQSAFGEQMDSLADMVSFGAAPALIVYEWALKGLGKAGWIAAFVYCACAALRLARFNTNIGIVDKRYFQGLPSPAAAAVLIGFIWVMDDAGFRNVSTLDWLSWTAFGFTLYAGLTMVTNVPFYSFKDVSLKRSVPFIVIVAIALGIALINVHPPMVLFGLFMVYGLSGYVVYGLRKSRGKPVSVIATSTDEPDEAGLHR
ncbi:MAG: CDP-diacylglycerol--serine O-phosphatidyltransferase [Burkholderiales bacterium]|jgi:CDP-diacylglycerol--serine O-phosphatidyltransferase|nr:CDP-diacylglycerol--serine O-phosphatidyltransferase [Burkholderiales bacterium]MBP7520411.1 CDP-diacylglycerol--serine O-phosphatidyltransferase [Leptothrix sp. (in: b-proteobacteria)]